MRSTKDALLHHVRAVKSGSIQMIFTSNQLIHLYSKNGLFREARKLFDEMPQRNVISWNMIISSNIKSRNLVQAREFFDAAPSKDLVSYNSMLSGYVGNEGYETQAVKLLSIMRCHDWIRIDEVSVTTMLNLSAKVCNFDYGEQLHCFMVKSGNDKSGFVTSSLIDMYSKCGCFKDAIRVFEGFDGFLDLVSKNAMVAACCRVGDIELAEKLFWREPELNDAVSWNTMISGYQQNGYLENSLDLFVKMGENGFRWNEHTFTSVLSTCAGLRNLKMGKQIHAWVLKNKLSSNSFVSSGIVDVYSKCGRMKYAELMHWASGSDNSYAVTSMIVGYSSQGNMVEARRLFDSLEEKNHVVWTALFSGYLKSHQCGSVFQLFEELKARETSPPDILILISVLGACALQATLDPGKQIHGYILRKGFKIDERLASTIMDMYSKCGHLTYAEMIFHGVNKRDSVIYNIMIAAYAHNGHENKAFLVFERMLKEPIRPDAVTFIALLSACRHCGLSDLGENYFNSMREDYRISPEVDHYACMIDLYGRANQLEKAAALLRSIPIEPDASILGAFLNACRLNKNSELAREAEEKLLRLQGDNGARYVQLANLYAAEGNWDEMGRIRKEMRGKVKKFAGCSWVYVDNKVNIFISNDTSHSKTEAVYTALDCLTAELHQREDDAFS